MKNLLVSMVMVFGWMTVSAQAQEAFNRPSDYAQMVQRGLVDAAVSCGFAVVDGRDPRLPGSVRARNARDVLVRVAESGDLKAHVLFATQDAMGHQSYTHFVWKRNGGQILEMSIDLGFDDLAIQAHLGGRVAYTTSSRKNGRVETVWRVRKPGGGITRVTEAEFAQYLQEKVIDFYGDRICRDLYR